MTGKRGISLVNILSRNEVEEIVSAFPDVSFELSYAMTAEFWRETRDIVAPRTVSIHSLSPRRDYFPNFASSDKQAVSWSMERLLEDARFAVSIGAEYLVIHPGYLLPGLVPSDSKNRIALLSGSGLGRFILKEPGSICMPSYVADGDYRKAFRRMKVNLKLISSRLSDIGVTLLCENLNPRAGYMNITPDEMVKLAEDGLSLCLDIGHLWMTSVLFGSDFILDVEKVLATGKVGSTHLHSNPTDGEVFIDSHESLDAYDLPWKRVLELIGNSKANMVLETVENPLHNLSLLF